MSTAHLPDYDHLDTYGNALIALLPDTLAGLVVDTVDADWNQFTLTLGRWSTVTLLHLPHMFADLFDGVPAVAAAARAAGIVNDDDELTVDLPDHPA